MLKILKMQRPLFSMGAPINGVSGEEWLLYDENRDMQTQTEPDDEMKKLMGDRLKCYVEVEFDTKAMTMEFIRCVEDQGW